MAKKDFDWENVPFAYQPTDYRFVSWFKDGKWDEGEMSTDPNVTLNECAQVLQYCQQVFEGLKAYETVDGRTVIFRPDMNAERMYDSAERMMMAPFPKDRFIQACKDVAKQNRDWIGPYGTGCSLYLRPYMIGTNPEIAVAPASEFMFRVIAMPVGNYFKGGVNPIVVRFADYDRAAPRGTGHIKAGLNYAMSMYPLMEAHDQGFAENFFLDSATRTKLEETGGANILLVTKDGKLVTQKSNSILPSITRRSLLYIAEHMLGMEVEQREVYKDELPDFAEVGVCGTAAVISPVGKVDDHGKVFEVPTGMEEGGPVLMKLRQTLVDIQMGKIEGPEGWVVDVDK